eukprot:3778882-Amphidinium_carterae.1
MSRLTPVAHCLPNLPPEELRSDLARNKGFELWVANAIQLAGLAPHIDSHQVPKLLSLHFAH